MSVHMHFLPELEVRCPDCKGKRFKEEVLRVTYNGYTISDILDMTIEESLSILEDRPKIMELTRRSAMSGLGI